MENFGQNVLASSVALLLIMEEILDVSDTTTPHNITKKV